MALQYVRPDPPVDGDGSTIDWQAVTVGGGGGAEHYTRVDEEWAEQDKDDYLAAANVETVEELKIAAGIGAATTGTMEYLAYFVYYDAIPNPDVSYVQFQIFLSGVQQGETKELQTNGLEQEKTIVWTNSDGTPFSVDCAAWYAGNRKIRMTYQPSGGGEKDEGELVDFFVTD